MKNGNNDDKRRCVDQHQGKGRRLIMTFMMNIDYNENSPMRTELIFSEDAIIFADNNGATIETIERLLHFVPNRFIGYHLVLLEYTTNVEPLNTVSLQTVNNIVRHPTIIRWERKKKTGEV